MGIKSNLDNKAIATKISHFENNIYSTKILHIFQGITAKISFPEG